MIYGALALLSLAASAAAAADVPGAEQTVSIAFVGDIMLDETPGKTIKRGRDPFESFAPLLNS